MYEMRELKRKYPKIPEDELEDAFAELETRINRLIWKYEK
jgi:hypothetical protein